MPYSILSNAWEMSRTAAEQFCLDSDPAFLACTMRWVWCMVECPCRKPNWSSGSNCLFCTMCRRRSRSIFSKTLERTGRRLIGR
jgi:hypothetical protein